MRKVLAVLIALVLAFSCMPVGYADVSYGNPFASARKGDILTFGSYEQDNNLYNGTEPIEWVVVETFSDCIKLVSRYALECMRFDSDTWPENWKSSDVRKWLNESFYYEAFTADEQQMIDLARVPNRGNEEYEVKAQGDTYDMIFLLDEKEVRTYFGSDTGSGRLCQPTKHAIANGAYVRDYSGTTWWWTRTPGKDLTYTAYVGSGGNLDYEGNPNNWENGCVRPALLVSTTRSMSSSSSSSQAPSSDMLYCPYCGKRISADSNFCMYCGRQLKK